MVEATIRVERTHLSNGNKPSFGNTIVKEVYEESHYHDKDERKNIAPKGVNATISIDRSHTDFDNKEIDARDIFAIKVNRRYLDYEYDNGYITFFHSDSKVYELYVKFDENGDIENINLSEWLSEGEFEDGEDADNVYSMKDFVAFETYE